MKGGEVIGLCTTGIASGAGLDKQRVIQEMHDLLQSGVSLDASSTDPDAFDPEGPGREVVESTNEEVASGLSIVTLREFKAAARRLKQTESDYREAQQAYGEAVKRLSDEAVK